MFLVLIVPLASAMQKDENTDCIDKQHCEDGYHNVIEEDKDQDDLENPEQDPLSNGKAFKMEGDEEREPKQLQFSRLVERCVCFFLLMSDFVKQ